MQKPRPEPWLLGTHSQIPALPRAALHAIELAEEGLCYWSHDFSDQELMATPRVFRRSRFISDI